MITVTDYMQFCQVHEYFTCGSNQQYRQALQIVEKIKMLNEFRKIRDKYMVELAAITWVCTDPDYGLSTADIERQLWKLYRK